MSIRPLVIASALLAACTSEGSVAIDVTAPAGATHIALYFSVGAGETKTIGPPGFQFPLPTTAWPRDPQGQLDVRHVTMGDKVAFELSRGTGNESKVTLAIVVAYGADDRAVAAAKLTDLDIPSDRIDHHVVALRPIMDGLTVKSWGPEGDPAPEHTCVVYGDELNRTIDMVVRADDPDCDGFVEGDRRECVPNQYMAMQTPVALSSCLLESTITTNTNTQVSVCELGGPSCTDGVGPDMACTSSHYCIPDNICDSCNNGFACAANMLTLGDAYPTHLKCRVGTKTDGTICGDEMLAWADIWPNLAGRMCIGAPRITRGSGWSNVVSASPTAGAQVSIEVKELQPNCNFKVKVTGSLSASIPTGTFLLAGLVAGALDNGRGVGIPVFVMLDHNVLCGTPPTCEYVGDAGLRPDNLFECANAPL